MTNAIIVGNGPSMMIEAMGQDIDSYDTVIRLKRCQQQLEMPAFFGTRTDILAGSLTIAPQLKNIPSSEYWILTDSRHQSADAKRLLDDMVWHYADSRLWIPLEACDKWNKAYREIRDAMPVPALHPQMQMSRYADERGEKHLSQGMLALVSACESGRFSHVVLAGFDNLYTGQFHWSLTRGPDWKQYPCHRWEIEHDMLPAVRDHYGVDIQFLLPDEDQNDTAP